MHGIHPCHMTLSITTYDTYIQYIHKYKCDRVRGNRAHVGKIDFEVITVGTVSFVEVAFICLKFRVVENPSANSKIFSPDTHVCPIFAYTVTITCIYILWCMSRAGHVTQGGSCDSPGVGQRFPLLASTRVKGILLRPFFLCEVGVRLRAGVVEEEEAS